MSKSMPNTALNSALLHVAAAVIYNPAGNILIARRPEHKHKGGLWEFPGGKVEANETASDALARELYEELGIINITSKPLIQITHHYPERSVLLDVYSVTAFSGEALGCEGQPIQWVKPEALLDFPFPEANLPIIEAVLKLHNLSIC
ncbi:8-oxo-dGTP diphosphatase MutT [Nitrincola schmidtii]|uniref:8-oxo-dGTP diphosphatase MutT n=1 Tax=Nitrincola schmidtii TaxID=1730894 RepID=UPI0023F3663E|nr:8-oxo-dGTP diphosphatase MutT [Nitrincola schmidtii]